MQNRFSIFRNGTELIFQFFQIEQKMMERFVILFCKQCSEYIHIFCVKKRTKENNRKIQLMGTPHSLSRKI